MAKQPNYKHEKRSRELAKQQKKEAKNARKLNKEQRSVEQEDDRASDV